MSDRELMLRIPVSGEWYAHEWSDFISAVDELYFDLAIIETINRIEITMPPQEAVLAQLRTLIGVLNQESSNRWESFKGYGPQPLRVAEIRYGSAGKLDLVGIGQAVEATADVIKTLIEFAGNAPDRERKRLENILKRIEILKAAGYSEDELKSFASDLLKKHDRSLLRKLIDSGRIEEPKALPPAPNWQNRALPPAPPQA